MVKKQQNKKNHDLEDLRFAALFSYIRFLCFIPLLKYSDNKYVMGHAKQGFILLVLEVIALLFLIDFVSHLFWALILLMSICCAVIGMFMVLMGKKWSIPLIGGLFISILKAKQKAVLSLRRRDSFLQK